MNVGVWAQLTVREVCGRSVSVAEEKDDMFVWVWGLGRKLERFHDANQTRITFLRSCGQTVTFKKVHKAVCLSVRILQSCFPPNGRRCGLTAANESECVPSQVKNGWLVD